MDELFIPWGRKNRRHRSYELPRRVPAGDELELQPERAAEESCDRGHLAASGHKERHELRAAQLSVRELHGRAEIAKLQVFHEFMIAGEATRRAAELGGIVPIEQSADSPPWFWLRQDRTAHSQQSGRVRMPQSTGCERTARLEMQIESRRVDVFTRVREAHGDMGLIRTFVGRESGITVNAEKGPAGRAGIGDQMRRDFIEWRREVGDKTERWLEDEPFVLVLVPQEPIAIVVALEASEETEQVGGEVGGHRNQPKIRGGPGQSKVLGSRFTFRCQPPRAGYAAPAVSKVPTSASQIPSKSTKYPCTSRSGNADFKWVAARCNSRW